MRSSPTFFKSRKIESVCIVVVPVRYSEADINQESSLVTQSLHFLRADIHCGVCYYGRICALPSAFLLSSIILVFLRFSFSGDWASNAEYIDQETVTCRFLWALLGFICVCVCWRCFILRKAVCLSLANARVSSRNGDIAIMDNAAVQHPLSRFSCGWAEREENNSPLGGLYLLYCSWQKNSFWFSEEAEGTFVSPTQLMTAPEL